MSVNGFFASHSSVVMAVVVAVMGSVAFGALRWCWARWVASWNRRAERRKLLDEFGTDAMNLANNMPRWLDGNPDECVILFPQGPQGVSKRIGPEVMGYVGKLQAHIMERLLDFNGLFGFSRRQHDLMMEVHRRLG